MFAAVLANRSNRVNTSIFTFQHNIVNKRISSITSNTLFSSSASSQIWQKEVKNLYQSYCIVQSILAHSEGLPIRTMIQYKDLQDRMISTLKDLLKEVEHPCGLTAGIHQSTTFYSRHSSTIKCLNNRLTQLLNATQEAN